MDANRRVFAAGASLLLGSPALMASGRSATPLDVPTGYRLVAQAVRIPAAVLYGVALQESALMFGEAGRRRPHPWPWTLNIAGSGERFATRAEAERRLSISLRSGIDSIDIGPMGINWRYHKDRLISAQQALEPYWNLQVGAALLLDHFGACRSWPEAVGRYHAPTNAQRAASYSASVFSRLRRMGHV